MGVITLNLKCCEVPHLMIREGVHPLTLSPPRGLRLLSMRKSWENRNMLIAIPGQYLSPRLNICLRRFSSVAKNSEPS